MQRASANKSIKISLFNRPRKQTDTAAQLKPLIQDKNFEYNHIKCQQQYFRAMDLRAMNDQSSRLQAVSILQDLFYNKMMSYQTDEISYILKEHIVLNYWKILQQMKQDTKDKKIILRMLRIGHLYLSQQYQNILPKNNNLQLLSLILARQEFASSYLNQALNVCVQAQNFDNKLTKDKSNLLKIHYLKVKIYNKLNQPQYELKQINKCFHYLKTLTQKQKNQTYSHFRKNLILRKSQLIQMKNKKMGIIGQQQLIINLTNNKQKQSIHQVNNRFRISKSQSKQRKNILANSVIKNRKSCNNKEDESIDSINIQSKNMENTQSLLKKYASTNFLENSKKQFKSKSKDQKQKVNSRFPIKVFNHRLNLHQVKNKPKLRIQRQGYKNQYQQSKISKKFQSKKIQLDEIMKDLDNKDKKEGQKTYYLNYLISRPGDNKKKESPVDHKTQNKLEKKTKQLNLPNYLLGKYQFQINQVNKRQDNQQKIKQIVQIAQHQVLNKFLCLLKQKKQQKSLDQKRQIFEEQRSLLQEFTEGDNYILNQFSQFHEAMKSKINLIPPDLLDLTTHSFKGFIFSQQFGEIIKGQIKIIRDGQNLHTKTLNTLTAFLYSTKNNNLQQIAKKTSQFSLRFQGSFTLKDYTHCKFNIKIPGIFKNDHKIYNIINELANQSLQQKNKEYDIKDPQVQKQLIQNLIKLFVLGMTQDWQGLKIRCLFDRFKPKIIKNLNKTSNISFNKVKTQNSKLRNSFKNFYQQFETISIQKTDNLLSLSYIHLYQQYKQTISQVQYYTQKQQSLKSSISYFKKKSSTIKSFKNFNRQEQKEKNKQQIIQISYFDHEIQQYRSFETQNSIYPLLKLKKYLKNKKNVFNFLPFFSKHITGCLDKAQGQLLKQINIQKDRSILNKVVQKLVFYFTKHQRSKNYNRVILDDSMKYLLIQSIQESYSQLTNFFDINAIQFLAKISNHQYNVKFTKYSAKQLYSNQGQSFYKIEAFKKSSNTRKMTLILTEKDIQDVAGNNIKYQGFDFTKTDICNQLVQFTKKIVIRRDYLYENIGILIQQSKFYLKNQFRNSLQNKNTMLKSFLQQHLNLLKILYQKVSMIKLNNKKVYAIITVSTITGSLSYQLRIYFPTISRHYSLCFDRNIIKYFDKNFLNEVFGEQIKLDFNENTQQYICESNKLLCSDDQKGKCNKYWGLIFKRFEYEIGRKRQQQFLILKVGNFRGYIRDSSLVSYVQQNHSIIRIEISLQKKESKIKVLNYNKVLVNMLQKLQNNHHNNNNNNNKLIQKKQSENINLNGNNQYNLSQIFNNLQNNKQKYNQCIQTQVIQRIESISDQKAQDCLIYVAITNIDSQKTINYSYKLSDFLVILKKSSQKDQNNQNSPQNLFNKQLQNQNKQQISSQQQSISSLLSLSFKMNKSTYNDFNQQTFSYARILRGFQIVKQKIIYGLRDLYSVNNLFACQITQYRFTQKIKQQISLKIQRRNVGERSFKSLNKQLSFKQKNHKILSYKNSKNVSFQNKNFLVHETQRKKLNKMIEKNLSKITIYTGVLDIQNKKFSKIKYDKQKRELQFQIIDNKNFECKAIEMDLDKLGYPFLNFYNKDHLKVMNKRIFMFNKNLILSST